jgi:hypothetical protein
MEKKEIQHKTDLLLASIYLLDPDRKQYVDWAINLLQNGVETPDLYILAGLDVADQYFIEHYFGRISEELGLIIDRKKEELFHISASVVAQKVVKGTIDPRKGLNMMENIWIQSIDFEYSNVVLNQFVYLAEDISLLGEHQLFYIGLTEENIDEVIVDEMRMFLLEQPKEIKDVCNLIFCYRCNDFSNSKYKEKDSLIKQGIWCCEKCDSMKYLAWYNVANRKEILKMLEEK